MTVTEQYLKYEEIIRSLNTIVFGDENAQVVSNGVTKPSISNFLDKIKVELNGYTVEQIQRIDQIVASIEAEKDRYEDLSENRIQELRDILNTLSPSDGAPSSLVHDLSGDTQQVINDRGGSKWRNKSGGYATGESVLLDNGIRVRSTVNGNSVNPNLDMSGWTLTTASEIVTGKGTVLEFKLNEHVSVHDYCKCDNSDETVGFIAAVEEAKLRGKKLVAFGGKLKLSSDVNLRKLEFDLSSLHINMTGTSKLIVGWASGTSLSRTQAVGTVQRDGTFHTTPSSALSPSVQMMGSKCLTFKFDQIDYMEMYASTDPLTYPHDASIAYCKLIGSLITRLDFATDPRFANGDAADGAGGSAQWINSNFFYIDRMMGVTIDGSYRHNGNVFYSPTLENASSYIRIIRGNKNIFMNIRAENYPEVYFGKDTQGNLISRIWFSTQSSFLSPEGYSNFTDLGSLNKYTTLQESTANIVPIMELNAEIYKSGNGRNGNFNYILPTRKWLRTDSNYRYIQQTNIFDVSNSDVFYFECDSIDANISRYGIRIYLYDANNNLVTDNDLSWVSGANFGGVGPGFFDGSVNSGGRTWFNLKTEVTATQKVKRMSIALLSGLHSQSRSKRIKIFMATTRNHYDKWASKIDLDPRYKYFISKPTKYVGEIGDILPCTNGTQYFCSFSLATSLSQGTGVGEIGLRMATTSISGVGGVLVGDLIGIDLDDEGTHWTSVSAVGGGIVTIADAIPSYASAGAGVYVSRLVG